MTDPTTSSPPRRILVVEDELILADDLAHELERAGALVIGPAPDVETALRLLDATPILDGAILDLNLHGTMSFPVADALRERGVPFVFATGYDPKMIPEAYLDVPRYEKPIEPQEVIKAVLS